MVGQPGVGTTGGRDNRMPGQPGAGATGGRASRKGRKGREGHRERGIKKDQEKDLALNETGGDPKTGAAARTLFLPGLCPYSATWA